jgi:hypothetical protein
MLRKLNNMEIILWSEVSCKHECGLQLPVVVWSADCQVALYGHADDQVNGPTQGDPENFFYPISTLRDENRYRYFVM